MKAAIRGIHEKYRIVGRDRELRYSLACLSAGRNLMLEGPVGVGKSVMAEALAQQLGKDLFRVDGDERYTEQKMIGWFDPALVLKGGYQPEFFIKGPLAGAMESGGILFVNEINRMPEAVQNVLLPAMEERRVVVPQYRSVLAKDGFLIIATQNPVEFVATSHLSEALIDRFEFVQLDYQEHEEEIEIVRRNLREPLKKDSGEELDILIQSSVSLVRKTRNHPKIRRGASVRAAIGMVEVAMALGGGLYSLPEAARISLLHRLEVSDESGQSAEAVLDEILDDTVKKKD
ncbi:MAG: AAA family ATPase [Candidatus Sumerlaeia bacterium]